LKRAFTLIELIFVVVLIGILSSLIAPTFERNSLQEVANQIMSHLRYTQHLALIDNKFDPKDEFWYKNRWQLYFSYCSGSSDKCAYTIFSDRLGTHSGKPDKNEIARNPMDPTKYMIGGSAGNRIIKYEDKEATKELNIGKKFAIKKVQFKECGSRALRISFDYLGRPLFGDISSLDAQYSSKGKSRLMKKQCKIILTNDILESITILIEPETGYAHLKKD
jgi:prepilin-type N-terminal cleavage/methylation domain-containing protein